MGTWNSRPNSQTSPHGSARIQRSSRSRKWRRLRPQVETVEPRILLSPGVVSASRNKAHAALLPVRAVPAHAPAPPNPTTVRTVRASRPVAQPAETAYVVPGQTGETIQATFALQDRNAAFRNEFGLFLVDDASGKIGKLKPGDRGYARAAIKNRITVFTRDQNAGATTNITLPGGRYFGTYLIQNSTAVKFLARNPLNQRNKLPKAFFSFTAANPDRFTHVKAPAPNVRDHAHVTGLHLTERGAQVLALSLDRGEKCGIAYPPEDHLCDRRHQTVGGEGAAVVSLLDRVCYRLGQQGRAHGQATA